MGEGILEKVFVNHWGLGWRGKGDHRKLPAAEVRVIVEIIKSQEQ